MKCCESYIRGTSVVGYLNYPPPLFLVSTNLKGLEEEGNGKIRNTMQDQVISTYVYVYLQLHVNIVKNNQITMDCLHFKQNQIQVVQSDRITCELLQSTYQRWRAQPPESK